MGFTVSQIFLRAAEAYKPRARGAGLVENKESGVCMCTCLCVSLQVSRLCQREEEVIQFFFLKLNNYSLLQQIRLHIPRGMLPYVVKAQLGILGTASSDDLSLSDAPYTAKMSLLTSH